MSINRCLSRCVLLFVVAYLHLPVVAADQSHTLPDLPLFVDERLAQWVGAGNGMQIDYEVDEYDAVFLPLDPAHQNDGLPSYQVNVTGQWGWWSVILAGYNWEPFSLAAYAPNGYLAFNIKNSDLPLDVQIGLADINFDRPDREFVPQRVMLADYLTASEDWQAVQIPLRDLVSEQNDFQLSQIASVQFTGVSGQPQLFWLNNMRFTSGDVEPSYPAIKVNQLGYTVRANKVAFVSGFEQVLAVDEGAPFALYSAETNTIRYRGNLTLVTPFDGASGERVLQADFSSLTAPGSYYVAVDGVEPSPQFTIRDDVYADLMTDALRYFYLQRAGLDLPPRHAGAFARRGGHQQDSSAELRSGAKPPMNVAGGWYDAGDYGKYTNAGATAISDLLWAYELFPDQFTDNQLNIPESGNGVPDILDEVRWELSWLLTMQDGATGGFYHAVQDTQDASPAEATAARTVVDVYVGNPKDPTDDRFHVIPTATTGSAVAALAHGALVFAPIDKPFAERLLVSAENGYQYLIQNPAGVASVDGPYADDDDHDDRFWAAAALYRATNDPRYHDYVRLVYTDVETLFDSTNDNAYGVGTVGMLGWLAYMHSDSIDAALADHFRAQFGAWSQMMATRHTASAWQTTLLDEDYYWGSNYVILTTPLVLAVGEAAMGSITPQTRQISQDGLSYLLGANPLRFSFVTGYGEDSVQQIYSMIWRNDAIDEEPAGVLAGGANAYTNPLLPSSYAAKNYVDSAGAWSVNEHTIYWNAALVFNLALTQHSAETASVPSLRSLPSPLQVVVLTSSSLIAIVLSIKAAQQIVGD